MIPLEMHVSYFSIPLKCQSVFGFHPLIGTLNGGPKSEKFFLSIKSSVVEFQS